MTWIPIIFVKDLWFTDLEPAIIHVRASQVALGVRNLPANARDIKKHGFNPCQEDSPEEGMATHPNILFVFNF